MAARGRACRRLLQLMAPCRRTVNTYPAIIPLNAVRLAPSCKQYPAGARHSCIASATRPEGSEQDTVSTSERNVRFRLLQFTSRAISVKCTCLVPDTSTSIQESSAAYRAHSSVLTLHRTEVDKICIGYSWRRWRHACATPSP